MSTSPQPDRSLPQSEHSAPSARIRPRDSFRDLFDAVRGAPAIVSGVYAPPVVLAALALGLTLYDLTRVLLDRADSMRMRGLVLAPMAFASYYVLAFVYAAAARLLVRPVRWSAAGAPRSAPSAASAPSASFAPPASRDAMKARPVLAISAPVGAARGARAPLEPWRPASATAEEPQPWSGEFRFRNIAIVLAGGGAKGVYQAGAMKAIYEFLAARGAVDRVVSIASTSIGSWNALFWLAGLMDPERGAAGRSVHEQWWTGVRPRHLVRPARDTVPLVAGHLLSHAPWEREFEALFGRSDSPGHAGLQRTLARDATPHFYMTRTNVNLARLAFETNFPDVVESRNVNTHDLDQARLATSIDRIREAVFTSMGIPPLFPYTQVRNNEAAVWAEDGGVIDNLPVRLATAFDRIDLLFVLPLNSSFFLPTRPGGILARLYRVVDVRGGLQERAALKGIYLFNQRFVLGGEHNPVPAFVITPGQPLEIGTVAFWRIPGAGAAVFDQMYRATRQALDEFFDPQNLWEFFAAYEQLKDPNVRRLPPAGYVRMIVVDPAWQDGNQFEFETRF